MGLHIRDDRQMQALTGLSQTQFDYLLLAFSDMYQVTHLPSPFCRKTNNFRGLFAFLRSYVATIKFAYTKNNP